MAPTATKGWIDDVSTEYAIEFIKSNQKKPFSLVLGYKTCHGPFTPPERHASTYGEAEAKVVPNLKTTAIYRPVVRRKAAANSNCG
jgi:phosphoglycerol transferase MdoB-like AlkP superfamily enzyme